MKTIVLVATLFLIGCSTTQVPWGRTTEIAPERLTAFNKPASKDAAEITVIRDEGLVGSACFYQVLIDEKPAARIAMTERATLFVEPGLRELKVMRDRKADGLCGIGDDVAEKMISVSPGEKRKYRITLDLQGWPSVNSYVE